MSTIQVRITLPKAVKSAVDKLAGRYGMTVSSYIRHIIVWKVIETDENIPVRKPSKSTLQAIRKADREFREGKTKQLPTDPKKLKAFFDNL